MSRRFDFENLVELCLRAHADTRRSAVSAVDASLVARNWLFGWYIVEFENGGADRSELYGKQLIMRLSNKLQAAGLKGCSPTNLRKFREFYRSYPEIQQTVPVESAGATEIRRTLSVNSYPASPGDAATAHSLIGKRFLLGWSHYVALLTIENPEVRRFYEIETTDNGWSVRELERQIASSLYERLALSRDKAEVRRLSRDGQVVKKVPDLIKNPLVLEFLGLEEKPTYSESELETAIIDRHQQFLLELGKGFLFEARQKRFSFDNRHFFVDIVFYNRLLRCYVLIGLKRGELTHQDLGQMQMYVNYFDRYVKSEDELPTVGIVLCGGKNDAVVELTLPRQANIYASKYQLYLPSKRELAAQLESIRRELDDRGGRCDE